MIKKCMEVHQYHSNITQKRHGASRNYRYILDVSRINVHVWLRCRASNSSCIAANHKGSRRVARAEDGRGDEGALEAAQVYSSAGYRKLERCTPTRARVRGPAGSVASGEGREPPDETPEEPSSGGKAATDEEVGQPDIRE